MVNTCAHVEYIDGLKHHHDPQVGFRMLRIFDACGKLQTAGVAGVYSTCTTLSTAYMMKTVGTCSVWKYVVCGVSPRIITAFGRMLS